MSTKPTAFLAEGRLPANDNEPKINEKDVPVFDAGRRLRRLEPALGEWSPPRQRKRKRNDEVYGNGFRFGLDGPSMEHRVRAQAAWVSSSRYRGQAANDNLDWPLAKLLRAENNDYLLRLAERYRDMWNAANMPCELRGTDMADNIYLLVRTDLDESTGTLIGKGVKKVTGKKARLEMAASSGRVPGREGQPRRPTDLRQSRPWGRLERGRRGT